MDDDGELWTVVRGRSEGRKEVESFSNHSRKLNKSTPSQQKAFKLRTKNGDSWVINSDSKFTDVQRERNTKSDITPTLDRSTDSSRMSSSVAIKKEKPDNDYSDKIGASFKTFVVRQNPDFTDNPSNMYPSPNKSLQTFGKQLAMHTHKNHTDSHQRSDHANSEDGPKRGTRGLLRINPVTNGLNEKVPPVESEEGNKGRPDISEEINLSNEADWPSIALTEGSKDNIGGTAISGSWSNVVKAPPPPRAVLKDDQLPTVVDTDSADEGEHDGKGKKKKKKKKKKGSGQPTVPNERRVDQPVMLEFGSMFERLEAHNTKKSKKIVLATGAAPVVSNLNTSQSKPNAKETTSQRSGNLLDSSAPAIRRGKEREIPKKKHPSALRKVITKEREEKKRLTSEQQQQQQHQVPAVSSSSEAALATEHEEGDQLEDVEQPLSKKPHPPTGVNKCTTIHSKRFREYCSHVVKDEINDCTTQLLTDLVRFQDRQYLKDPLKAKAKRRYVCGLREVTKHLKLRKLKCIIIPPNLDRIQSTGGIDDAVHLILTECVEQEVPVVFSMSRRRLAFVLKKNHKIGCVGIFSYDGAEAHYKRLMELVAEAKEEYQLKTAALNEVTSTNQQPLYLVQTNLDKTHPTRTANTSTSTQDTELQDLNSDSESEDSGVCFGNGTQQSLMDTPWRIFFQNGRATPPTSSSDVVVPHTTATHTTTAATIATTGASNNSTDSFSHDSMMSGLVEFETRQDILTSTPCVPLKNGDSSVNFQRAPLNVHANEFIPPLQFSLNINAQEFVPHGV